MLVSLLPFTECQSFYVKRKKKLGVICDSEYELSPEESLAYSNEELSLLGALFQWL